MTLKAEGKKVMEKGEKNRTDKTKDVTKTTKDQSKVVTDKELRMLCNKVKTNTTSTKAKI